MPKSLLPELEGYRGKAPEVERQVQQMGRAGRAMGRGGGRGLGWAGLGCL